MRKRIAEEKYHEIALARFGIYEGPYTGRTRDKTSWVCKFGHKWQACYTDVRRGTWCPQCAGVSKKSIKDCYDFALRKGGLCLESKYVNCRTKMLWQCAKGHKWWAIYANIKNNGTWCPRCDILQRGNAFRKTIEDCRNLANRRGGICLEAKYINNSTKMLWMCVKGHRWQASYHNVYVGKWCPQCVHRLEKEYIEIAARRGGKFIGPYTGRVNDNVEWQCEEGHRWLATYSHVSRSSWCKICAGQAKPTVDFVHDYLAEIGFILLEEAYVNGDTKLKVKCKKCGDSFTRSWVNFHSKKHHGCPSCGSYKLVNGIRASKPQLKIAQLLQAEEFVNYRVGRRSIDVALPKQNIAIEYDGMYWHKGREAKDKVRVDFLISQGWRVLSIKALAMIPTKVKLWDTISWMSENDIWYHEIVMSDWAQSV